MRFPGRVAPRATSTRAAPAAVALVVALTSAPAWMLASTAASAQQSRPAAERDTARAAAVAAADQAFMVGPEDVLEVSVWKEEGLRKDVLVLPDGSMSFPLVGDLAAAGRSIGDIRKEIGKRLEKFIPDPVVSVAVNRVASQRIYVIGKVLKPGDFPVGRYVDVLQALAMAGGLNPFAASNDIKIIRRDQGRQTVLPFRYSDVERGQRLEQNVVLQAGDVVVVP
jgi:polysaccharide export outer membrane protein